MEVQEIRDSIKELEKAVDADLQLEVLERLDREFKPTEALLRETKLGVAVNKLRTHSDPRVAALVKRMITRWKEQVQAQKAATQARARAAAKSDAKDPKDTKDTKDARGLRSAKSDGVKTAIYPESVRNSCVEVTYNALVVGSDAAFSAVLTAAKNIEAAVFAAEKGATPAYRTKMRSLFMNLKDPKNPTLRERVVSGDISAARLRTMSPQEMASEELRKEIQAIEKQNLFNAQGAKETRSVTDRFTCGKCKQKKVSYYQMQTRSADEPLTTFCTCEVCGNRWKFS